MISGEGKQAKLRQVAEDLNRVHGDLVAHSGDIVTDPGNFEKVLTYYASEVERLTDTYQAIVGTTA